jgi:hypothetical protein
MPLNRQDAGGRGSRQGIRCRQSEERLVGTVIKFPDEGRIVRFGHADAPDESATIIILPVVRIERNADSMADNAEPHTHPPANNSGRRRMRRR